MSDVRPVLRAGDINSMSDSLKETGRCAAAGIVEMVAALECDYDRLEELKEERQAWLDDGLTKVTAPDAWASYLINGDATGISDEEQKEADAMVASIGLGGPIECEDAGFVTYPDYGALAGDCQTYTFGIVTARKWENESEYEELTAAAGECTSIDDARTRIEEDALSVEVRGDWHSIGDQSGLNQATEFKILLSTGGPAVQIRGELDDNAEPSRAWLEVQDWGTPWTQYFDISQDTLLAYARVFYFGES